jgi:GT2 family glycosyltransferase
VDAPIEQESGSRTAPGREAGSGSEARSREGNSEARSSEGSSIARSARSLGPISVVVCNFDGERYLDDCLLAVAAMRGEVGEVIVVDNASTDRSLAILAERHPAVRVISMPENRGPCPARNAGMRAARHRWVLALDNDALVAPDTLEKLEAAALSRGDVALVQPRSVFAAEPARVHYDGGAFHYVGLIALRNFYRPIERAEGTGTVAVDCAVSVALLLDREVVLAAGGYDEEFFILFEDLDLSYRLRARGFTILSVEDALVLHRGGTPGISFRDGPRYPESRVFFHSRNRWLHLAKNYRLSTLLAASPGLLAYELVWLAFAVSSGGTRAWLRGKGRFFALLPRVLDQRRELFSRRTIGDRRLLAGGPLTVTPALREKRAASALLAGLDVLLRGWWRLARLALR